MWANLKALLQLYGVIKPILDWLLAFFRKKQEEAKQEEMDKAADKYEQSKDEDERRKNFEDAVNSASSK